MAFSPDNLKLAAGRDDGTVVIYEADPWWEPGNPPKKPEPVTITPGKAKPNGAEGNERFLGPFARCRGTMTRPCISFRQAHYARGPENRPGGSS